MAIPPPTALDLVDLALRPVERTLEADYGGRWRVSAAPTFDNITGYGCTVYVSWEAPGQPMPITERVRFDYRSIHREGALHHVATKIHETAKSMVPESQRHDVEFCEAMLDLVYNRQEPT